MNDSTRQVYDYTPPHDKHIGFPIIIGSRAVRKGDINNPDLKAVTYEWEFYIRSVYLIPEIYGCSDFRGTPINKRQNTQANENKQNSSPQTRVDNNLIGDMRRNERTIDQKINTLEFIDKVIINLHPSFPNPIVEIPFETSKALNKGNEFIHRNSGWGEFEIRATIILKNNRQIKITHFLKLHVQDPNSRIFPDEKMDKLPEHIVINERFDTIILKNPGDFLYNCWSTFYSDLSTFSVDNIIDPDEQFMKLLPRGGNWLRGKGYGEQEEADIDRAINEILELIENAGGPED